MMEPARTGAAMPAPGAGQRTNLRHGLGRRLGLGYRWLIWVLITLFAFNQTLQTFAYPVLVPALLQEINLSYVMAGGLMSAYMLPMTAVMMPAGMLADRIGSRGVVLGGLALISVGTLLFAMANSYPLAVVSRVVMGVGAGIGIIMPSPVLAHWFSKAEFRSVLGLHVGVGKAGSILATWILPPLALALGWRLGYGVVSLIGPLTLLLTALFLVSRPSDIGLPDDKQFAVPGQARPRPDRTEERVSVRQLATSGNFLLLTLAQFFIFGAYYGGINWLPTYFKVVVGLDEVEAGFQTGIVLWGTIIGFALTGPVCNWLGRCLPVYRFGAAGIAVCLALFATSVVPVLPGWTWPPLMLVCGLCIAVVMLFMTIVAGIVPANSLGTAIGFGYTLSYIGSIVTPALMGAVADYTGSLTVSLYVPTFCAAACALLALFVKENAAIGKAA